MMIGSALTQSLRKKGIALRFEHILYSFDNIYHSIEIRQQ